MIYEIIEKLRQSNSSKYKISILEENKDNQLLQRVLQYTYNPFYQFYIKKIPEYLPEQGKLISLDDALNNLDKLRKREITGNEAIKFLQLTLSQLNKEDSEVIKLVINKDVSAGISTKTINKVFGESFLFEYPCMLCTPFNEKTIQAIKYPAISQSKEDGMRFNALVHDGIVEYRSRNGKLIEFHGSLDNFFLRMVGSKKEAYVFDGELLIAGKDKSVLARKIGNGIINKAIKGTINDEEADKIIARLWDIIPYEDFQKGKYNLGYIDRFEILKEFIQKANSDRVQLVDSKEVNNFEEARNHYNAIRERRGEGTILKNKDAPWENKRSKYQVKMKEELSTSLKVVGQIEGTGKYKGMLGAIECESSDGKLKVNVGSGFTDEMRKNFIKHPITGKIVEIKYNDIIFSMKEGEPPSLFLPIFIEIREDRDEADTLEHIEAQNKGTEE